MARRLAFGLGTILAVLALAAGGYAVGTASGADVEAARQEGKAAGFERGRDAGARAGRAAGIKTGRRRGYRRTYRRAYRSAYAKGEARVEAQGAIPAAGQPTSCGAGLVSASNGCVPESEAVCAAYQDFVPGQGCVPPLEPGAVEAEPECPPGQVPVGVTGACARP